MGETHGLRSLQMGVTGNQGGAVVTGLLQQGGLKGLHLGIQFIKPTAQPQA